MNENTVVLPRCTRCGTRPQRDGAGSTRFEALGLQRLCLFCYHERISLLEHRFELDPWQPRADQVSKSLMRAVIDRAVEMTASRIRRGDCFSYSFMSYWYVATADATEPDGDGRVTVDCCCVWPGLRNIGPIRLPSDLKCLVARD